MREITSRDNDTIKYISRIAVSASFRKKENSFLCEGARLCGDALKSGIKVRAAFFTENAANRDSDLLLSVKGVCEDIYILPQPLFKRVSDTSTPQGVMLLCECPSNSQGDMKFSKAIALERIQDPQNLGTVLRSAEAFGIDLLIMSKDCCDIFSPKVLRGSMGAVFRQRILIPDDFYSYISDINKTEIKTYAAVVKNGQDVLTVDFSHPCCVLIGNEGNGLSERAVSLCGGKLTINMNGRAESLNAAVASSLIMWEMVRGNRY